MGIINLIIFFKDKTYQMEFLRGHDVSADYHHPLVGDFQFTHIFTGHFYDTAKVWFGYAFLFALYLICASIDMMFWSAVLFPVLIFSIPAYAIYLMRTPTAIATINNNWLGAILKRWADAATWFIWWFLAEVGVALWDDKWLPLAMFTQWLLLPFNALAGLFVLILFPIEILCIVYITIFNDIWVSTWFVET